jgi:membrane protease YdiL (CAAX protease family)
MTGSNGRVVSHIPLTLRAIGGGLVMAMPAASVWVALVTHFSVPLASGLEMVFLGLYFRWATGRGSPGFFQAERREFGRAITIVGNQWGWGLLAAVAFAATIYGAIVLLFRLIPFPAATFHAGYSLSFIPTLPMKWLTCVVSALSAGVCEEIGFRGYMQRPIEKRHGPVAGVAVSSIFFMLLHLNKSWSLLAMTPIVLGAGILLGVLACKSGTLVFCIIGHTLMDIGLFAYWWAQIAGSFEQRPISETGLDLAVFLEVGVFGVSAALFALATNRLTDQWLHQRVISVRRD